MGIFLNVYTFILFSSIKNLNSSASHFMMTRLKQSAIVQLCFFGTSSSLSLMSQCLNAKKSQYTYRQEPPTRAYRPSMLHWWWHPCQESCPFPFWFHEVPLIPFRCWNHTVQCLWMVSEHLMNMDSHRHVRAISAFECHHHTEPFVCKGWGISK